MTVSYTHLDVYKRQTGRRQDLGALRGDDPRHHRKHTDGAEGNNERHHALDDRIERCLLYTSCGNCG